MTGPQAREALPRPVLVVLIALPLLLAVAAAVIALASSATDTTDGTTGGNTGGSTGGSDATAPGAGGPLVLPAVPAPAANSAECTALLAALPQRLQSGATQLDRRPLAQPAPPGTAAWGVDPIVILRCGVDRPAELTPTAALLEVSGVRWLHLPGADAANPTSTWVAVDRPVYVALTMPDDAGTGPLQDISAAVRATLAARPVAPAR